MLGGISRACGMQRVCFTVSGQHPRSGIPHRKTSRPSLDEEVPSNWESSGRQQIPRTGERWGEASSKVWAQGQELKIPGTGQKTGSRWRETIRTHGLSWLDGAA